MRTFSRFCELASERPAGTLADLIGLGLMCAIVLAGFAVTAPVIPAV